MSSKEEQCSMLRADRRRRGDFWRAQSRMSRGERCMSGKGCLLQVPEGRRRAWVRASGIEAVRLYCQRRLGVGCEGSSAASRQ